MSIENLHIAGKLGVIIPAFNESKSIANVISQAKSLGTPIVVNDASSDRTEYIAEHSGAIVVSHTINRGYEAALCTGLQYAMEHGFDFVVTMDADGQHSRTAVQQIVQELVNGRDLVVGTRDRFQRWSEVVFGWVGRVLVGLPDPLCGLKGYRVSCIRDVPINSFQSVGTELAVRLIALGYDSCHIPVTTQPREGLSRYGSGFKTELRVVKACIDTVTLYYTLKSSRHVSKATHSRSGSK